jgi:hypothetical protein
MTEIEGLFLFYDKKRGSVSSIVCFYRTEGK